MNFNTRKQNTLFGLVETVVIVKGIDVLRV